LLPPLHVRRLHRARHRSMRPLLCATFTTPVDIYNEVTSDA
jgi:hypothetical protein